ncbi:MAG TPA: hypothetical protein VK629_05285 [Steroidobacteraceae bacterium]|nr:hypothetical protein [Steroidobacteraceae bacterium]
MLHRLLITAMLLVVSQTTIASCFDARFPKGESITEVVTLPPSSGARFYFHTFDFGTMLFVEAADLVSALEESESKFFAPGDKGLATLLQQIGKDLPLKVHTDLFKYALHDPSLSYPLQLVLADMLAGGKSGVYNRFSGDFSKSIVLKRWNDSKLSAKKFFDNGNQFFFSIDCTVD